MIPSLFDRLHRLLDSPAGAVLGGAAYGSWATFANWVAGVHMALRIGLTHFALSTGLTLFGVSIMNRLFAKAEDPRIGALIAAFGSLAFTYALLISVHWMIGTPRILLTLAPGLLPTLAFCTFYSLLLLRQAQQPPPQSFRSVA